MLIAKVNGQTVEQVGDFRELFPNTTFPPSGPDAQFMASNSCLPVTVWKPYDHGSEKLVQVTPYIENNQVFTVAVEAMTPEEIAAIQEAQLNAKRSAMVVSPFQAKAALAQIGKLDDVEALMADAATPLLTKLAWKEAVVFKRLSPTIIGLSQQLGFTDEQLDELFETAAQIVA